MPDRLTDAELRAAIADCDATDDDAVLHETPSDVREWLTEVLELRARVTELEGKRDTSRREYHDLHVSCEKRVEERNDARAVIDRVRDALAGHPRCEEHPEGDVIKCGWKRAVGSVQAALDASPADQQPSGYVVGWEETEGRVTIALDESEPHPGGGPDRFAYTDLGDARMFLAEISPEDPDTTFHVYELREVAE